MTFGRGLHPIAELRCIRHVCGVGMRQHLKTEGPEAMMRGTEPLQIWEIISSPAGYAALQYAAESGHPPIEPLVGLIEEWWGPWLDDDREAHLQRVHGMVSRLMAANGWEEAGLQPLSRGRLITQAMTFRRAGDAPLQ
jgi:hypothetical protein